MTIRICRFTSLSL